MHVYSDDRMQVYINVTRSESRPYINAISVSLQKKKKDILPLQNEGSDNFLCVGLFLIGSIIQGS